MSDPFEKNTEARGKVSTSKVVMMVALALVLVGVVLMQFTSIFHPGAATAAEGDGSAALAVGTTGDFDPSSAAKAIANLAHDPTASLLQGNGSAAVPDAISKPPSNPFSMSPALIATLVKKPVAVAPAPTPAAPAPAAPAPAPAFDASVIKLQAVSGAGAKAVAIVNGQPAYIGQVVSGARIVEIQTDHLVCQPVGQSEAARFSVFISRQR